MDKTSVFTEKAKLIHFDKYEYNKVNYINAKEKVIIICKIHGEFIQTPDVKIMNIKIINKLLTNLLYFTRTAKFL